MRITQHLLFYATCLMINLCSLQAITVTYSVNNTNFEDNLLSFAQAKWLANLLNADLLYMPFPGSEQLKLDQDFSLIRENKLNSSHKIVLNHEQDFIDLLKQYNTGTLDPKTLIELPFSQTSIMQINWDEPAFHKQLTELISPLIPISPLSFPQGGINVAIHDIKNVLIPTSNLFESYYKDALKNLYKALGSIPMNVVIFTDAAESKALLQKFQKSFSKYDIKFTLHNDSDAERKTPLEKFFILGQFDCLIRNDSHFSLMASKIFPYKGVVSPYRYSTTSKKTKNVDRYLFEIKPTPHVKKPIKTIFR